LSEVWSYIETKNESLEDTGRKMAAESRRTAKIFNADACGVIYGPCSEDTLENLKWYGLKKVFLLQGGPLASPETIAGSLQSAALKYGPQLLLFTGSPAGSELAARTAAFLERGVISNCTDFELQSGKPLARKVVYKGKADAIITWVTPPPYLATIYLPALEDVREKARNAPEIINEETIGKDPLTRLVRRWEVSLSELDITEARVVIGVGRGVRSAESMELVNRLARQIKGIVGGTRIAVYSGLVPLEKQIGTTGKWISSDLYLTLGVSGAPQHVMGIKEVKNIIAINISREVPIFKYARLGIIGDLYEIVPRLIDLIESGDKKEA
jgi:electron transfer flavoprotein alpha subunit